MNGLDLKCKSERPPAAELNGFQIVFFNIGRFYAMPEEKDEAFQFVTVPTANRILFVFRPISLDGQSFCAGCFLIGQAYHFKKISIFNRLYKIPEATFLGNHAVLP